MRFLATLGMTGSTLVMTGSALVMTGSALGMTGSALGMTGATLVMTDATLVMTGGALGMTGVTLVMTAVFAGMTWFCNGLDCEGNVRQDKRGEAYRANRSKRFWGIHSLRKKRLRSCNTTVITICMMTVLRIWRMRIATIVGWILAYFGTGPPPVTWKCRWKTSCPAPLPWLHLNRYPDSTRPVILATSPVTTKS